MTKRGTGVNEMLEVIASWRKTMRRPLNEKNRRRLQNHAPSVIASNCNGGVLCHDLGLRFNSPTVNLFIPFPDYVRFCEKLEHYLSLPPEAMTETALSLKYPTGYLEDVHLHFVHYATFEEAKEKWFERTARVDFGNLYFMLAQRDGCTSEDIRAFDALPYDNKVAFVDHPMPDVQCAFYDPTYVAEEGGVKVLTDYKSKLSYRRIMDTWDGVAFLNGHHG